MNLTELRDCARRELKLRERVYPRWVEKGKMTPMLAYEEIRKMREIAEYLDQQSASERLL